MYEEETTFDDLKVHRELVVEDVVYEIVEMDEDELTLEAVGSVEHHDELEENMTLSREDVNERLAADEKFNTKI